jgi:hypothetical protein
MTSRRAGQQTHDAINWRVRKGSGMPRYMVQRTFDEGLDIPVSDEGAKTCRVVDSGNAAHDVHWVHSYVSTDKARTFCVYDAPSPEAIRLAAADNGLPVDLITEVSVLDPYFYH